jgi:hypothetical protein
MLDRLIPRLLIWSARKTGSRRAFLSRLSKATFTSFALLALGRPKEAWAACPDQCDPEMPSECSNCDDDFECEDHSQFWSVYDVEVCEGTIFTICKADFVPSFCACATDSCE